LISDTLQKLRGVAEEPTPKAKVQTNHPQPQNLLTLNPPELKEIPHINYKIIVLNYSSEDVEILTSDNHVFKILKPVTPLKSKYFVNPFKENGVSGLELYPTTYSDVPGEEPNTVYVVDADVKKDFVGVRPDLLTFGDSVLLEGERVAEIRGVGK